MGIDAVPPSGVIQVPPFSVVMNPTAAIARGQGIDVVAMLTAACARLPTSDPHIAGSLYIDSSGHLTVSQSGLSGPLTWDNIDVTWDSVEIRWDQVIF